MRMLMKVRMDTQAGNTAITNGKLATTMMEFIERAKPEAAYFAAEEGMRTAYFFLDMASTTDLPSLAEPFFQALGASIEVTPAMNADEMQAGVRKYSETMRRAA